ncbi:MAG: glycosyltransferase, partial [Candidatus Latescibacteria bacterium]|nr:glycosyltransferase [Candidatus Latescibacterota bacterium]
IEKLESDGLDLVSGWKKVRHDPLSKRIPSRFFNYATRFISGLKLHDFNCGLKAYRVEVVRVLRVHGELHRYIPAIAYRAGFRVGEKPVNHRPRRFGRTKFGPSRFLHGFLDLLTVMFLNRYLSSPLHLFGLVGGLILVAGVVLNVYLLVEKIMGRSIGQRPLLFLAVMMVIVGIQFIFFGLLGEMMAREPKEGETYLIESVWPDEAE